MDCALPGRRLLSSAQLQPEVGKTSRQVAGWTAGTAAQGGLKGGFDITYLVSFSNVLNAGVLINIFT